tara:strand:- start:826 stop:1053 length:228 start_codon:yes stop_codon:yes gene_type:complete
LPSQKEKKENVKSAIINVIVQVNFMLTNMVCVLATTVNVEHKMKDIKHRVEHFYLMNREYILGGVIGFILGAIIF